nr:aspartyl protease APCB1 [Ipomoea batatas]
MTETEGSPPQQLTGVVIITLPPPGNPCLGKTITAYTISDDFSPSTQLQNDPQPPPQQNQSPQASVSQFQHQRRVFGRPMGLLSVLGISLVALFAWFSLTQEIVWELADSDDDRRANTTFLLPLHPKTGLSGLEVKLGRFKKFQSDVVMETVEGAGKIRNSVAAVSKLNSTSFSLKGNVYPDGLYYTYALIGNPPKPYFLDVDTGSDLTWIQCDAPCTSCAKGAHPFYKPAVGNIIRPEDSYCVEVKKDQENIHCETCHQCDYEVEYADRSSSLGVLLRDETRLMVANGTLCTSTIIFGCGYDQQGSLLDTLAKTDGILGLSRAKISLPSQLASQGFIENVVGHCLSSDAAGGGYMFFGNDFVPDGKMAWVPMLDGPYENLYQTEVLKMSYGGKGLSLDNPRGGQGIVIFDSGSSYTYFTGRAYKDLVSILNDVSTKGLVRDPSDTTLPICWKAEFAIRSVSDVSRFFKPLNLQFGSKWWIVSKILQIPPEGYLVISKKGNVCLGILDGSKIDNGFTFILGDVTLRGQLFAYDNVKQRIGWVKSNCASPKKFMSLPFS